MMTGIVAKDIGKSMFLPQKYVNVIRLGAE